MSERISKVYQSDDICMPYEPFFLSFRCGFGLSGLNCNEREYMRLTVKEKNNKIKNSL